MNDEMRLLINEFRRWIAVMDEEPASEAFEFAMFAYDNLPRLLNYIEVRNQSIPIGRDTKLGE